MHPEETIDFHLRWGWQKLARLYTAEAERRGIPFSYVFVLLQIDREGTPSTKLGPRMGMESTSLSRTLKGMEEMGLIERRKDPNDGRSVRVFLTALGVDARRQARDLVVGVNQRLRAELGEPQVNALIAGLKQLNEILERPDWLLAGGPSPSQSTSQAS
jgi:DNA-binding MarR family transcriptional regulator